MRNILQPDTLRKLFSIDWIMHYEQQKSVWGIHSWRFIVLTGLRRGELCGLRKEDLKNDLLHVKRFVNNSNQSTPGKNSNAQRIIGSSNRSLDVLNAENAILRECGIISPWLFPGADGNHFDSNRLYKTWYTCRKQHGIDSSLHDLRHTMISIVSPDIPDSLLKPAVGHSKHTDTHGIYDHRVEGETQRTAALIDMAFLRILGQ